MKFTTDEYMMIVLHKFDCSNRQEFLEKLAQMKQTLELDETWLGQVIESTLEKVKQISEEEYEAI